MRMYHQNGCTREKLLDFRQPIYEHVIESAHAIVFAMQNLNVNPMLDANRLNVERILNYNVEASPSLPEEVAVAIHDLWNDPIMLKVMDSRSNFHLMESTSYFLAAALRISKPGYVPTELDVLHAKNNNETYTGFSETRIKMGVLTMNVTNIAGQHSLGKTWNHCFEHVTSIIFCASLNDYDQPSPTRENETCLTDSFHLFESIANSRWFLRTSIILILTNVEFFRHKLATVPLERYLPEYTGGADANKAAKYILWRFMQMNRAPLNVYPHFMLPTDTVTVRLIFSTVKETILQNAIRDSGTPL